MSYACLKEIEVHYFCCKSELALYAYIFQIFLFKQHDPLAGFKKTKQNERKDVNWKILLIKVMLLENHVLSSL